MTKMTKDDVINFMLSNYDKFEWKHIHSNSFNIFGAKFDHCYDSENFFDSYANAIKAIENHKDECRKNRKEWITSNRKSKKSITYM